MADNKVDIELYDTVSGDVSVELKSTDISTESGFTDINKTKEIEPQLYNSRSQSDDSDDLLIRSVHSRDSSIGSIETRDKASSLPGPSYYRVGQNGNEGEGGHALSNSMRKRSSRNSFSATSPLAPYNTRRTSINLKSSNESQRRTSLNERPVFQRRSSYNSATRRRSSTNQPLRNQITTAQRRRSSTNQPVKRHSTSGGANPMGSGATSGLRKRNSLKSSDSSRSLNDGGKYTLRRFLNHRKRSSRDVQHLSMGELDNHEALQVLARQGSNEYDTSMDSAAAQLVAAGMSGAQHRHRFGTNEYVLVSLEVMNKAALPELIARDPALRNALNEKDMTAVDLDSELLRKSDELEQKFTTQPVNKFGFPEGQGTRVEEQRGPYLYVIAKVKMVHFEEDARYYTVTRCDTSMDQRADAEWMWGEPISSETGVEAALRAAKQNTKEIEKQAANRSNVHAVVPKTRFETFLELGIYEPFSKFRVFAKNHITNFLLGLSPYSFELRISGVNILVCCGILFMLLDQIRISFAPPAYDRPLIILNATIWVILVIELMLEVVFRPQDYSSLIISEKKYNPSTARFLNNVHLFAELLALILFIPEMQCLFVVGEDQCGEALPFTLLDATMKKSFGTARSEVAFGTLIFAFVRLRLFGPVRHFKQMWFTNNIIGRDIVKKETSFRSHSDLDVNDALISERERLITNNVKKDRQDKTLSSAMVEEKDESKEKKGPTEEEDRRLNDAANIGTALIVINSHRAMYILIITVTILPFIIAIMSNGGANQSKHRLISQLQQINLILPQNDTSQCADLEKSIANWIVSLDEGQQLSSHIYNEQNHPLLWARLLPIRCDFQVPTEGLITSCKNVTNENLFSYCDGTKAHWNDLSINTSLNEIAASLNTRVGNIYTERITDEATGFSVEAYMDPGNRIFVINLQSILLQVILLLLILISLSVLRSDAGRLVLEPLRRMIKIVLHYAKNPLAPAPTWTNKKNGKSNENTKHDGNDDHDNEDELGNFETEQLITAVTKITDLLRKCWGVAGAGIISSNLARTQSGKTVVFNPLVPGKLVYALFGFCGIMDFAYLLHALDHSVIELINDVAKVVHDEVFRWGLGSRGQCNKNLGGAFLMVHRIGDFKEVHEKKDKATNVIFDHKQVKPPPSKPKANQRKKKQKQLPFETVELASLPGISAFTDRAVIGMLKSFAGIHRDRKLLKWREDFRLGAGVGAFAVNMIFGIDAGWGVEGAVGSEHKIDATYLSPHVNMAARMMSATKQFGVNLLLSQAAHELLSAEAKSKMRHLDTVSVKGSSVEQRIYTYDAKHVGVDFFLHAKSDRLAGIEADRFTPSTWNTDSDLLAMRQHVSEEFVQTFNRGRNYYLAGDWPLAIQYLKSANEKMIETILDEGVVEYEIGSISEDSIYDEHDKDEEVISLRKLLGDGPSTCLISYMENRGGVAPNDWMGYRPLTSK